MLRNFVLRELSNVTRLCSFVAQNWKAMADRGKFLEVTVREYNEKRSNQQNNRLWALHEKAAEITGASASEMHEIALCKFFGYWEVKIGGIIRQIPIERSSTKDKKRFAKFMEATEAFYISEIGISTGSPENAG